MSALHHGYPRDARTSCARGIDFATWPTSALEMVGMIAGDVFNSGAYGPETRGRCLEIAEAVEREISKRRATFIRTLLAHPGQGERSK
jgi:hypothetical protein